ncbi:hypothetical protein ABZP36_013511 [Zizania latifolia]
MSNVVLYPSIAAGHLTPMMELAKVFLERGFTVTVALLDDPMSPPTMSSTIERVVASHPSVSFHRLRAEGASLASGEHYLLRYFALIRQRNGQLRDFLCSWPVCAVVIDTFSVDACQLPSFHAKSKASSRELGDTPLEFVGTPPLPASHVPQFMLENPESKIFKAFLNLWEKITEFDGIMVNTFESLESTAAGALRDNPPRFLPGRALPPVYCVRPLVKDGDGGVGAERHHCLAWLDEQPDRSVVFLCFGSEGTHRREQLTEMAVGLENSGHQFAWVVQAPRSTDPTKFFEGRADPDLEALLPEGFSEWTSGRGLVV